MLNFFANRLSRTTRTTARINSAATQARTAVKTLVNVPSMTRFAKPTLPMMLAKEPTAKAANAMRFQNLTAARHPSGSINRCSASRRSTHQQVTVAVTDNTSSKSPYRYT